MREISLVNYVANNHKIENNDISLIIYLGKEYTKLIFMKGDKLFHIGATLSIGRNSGKINRLVLSKILYEREHSSIESPNNIFIYGEKISDEFTSLLESTYPSSSIKAFHDDQQAGNESENKDNFPWSSFSVPMAVANEYFNELNNKSTGIDLLPPYIREQQKKFQLAWHGIALFVGLFVAVMLMSYNIFYNKFKSNNIDYEINSLLLVQNTKPRDSGSDI